MAGRESNYEIMKHRMQAEFAKHDIRQIKEEWELQAGDGYLTVPFAGREYRVIEDSGAILYEAEGEWREADYIVSMTLFDILTRKRQQASGELLPVHSFSSLYSTAVPTGLADKAAAKQFDHRDDELAAVCRQLGGRTFGKGDVSYRLPVFRDLEVGVRFWDSDDEFDPELNMFCDGNTLQFMHYETMMYMLAHVLERLREMMK